jgi:quercetin dioxygenase-like cupin family protein
MELRNPVGGSLSFRLRAAESGGTQTLLETVAAAAEGPPLHVHGVEAELLYVLDGAFRFRLADAVWTASAGSLMFAPAGTAHTWQNAGAAPGRLLVQFTPGSPRMEAFFEGFAARLGESPGPALFAELAVAAGMTLAGPPLAVSHAPA